MAVRETSTFDGVNAACTNAEIKNWVTRQISMSTIFTWLNAAPRIVAALDWYDNRFRNYGCKHRLRASSNGRF